MSRFLRLAALVLVLAGANQANAAFIRFTAFLDGPSEAPPNASPGTGFAQIDFDPVAHLMRVQATFSDLIGTTTVAHIHAPTAVPGAGTAGVATQTPTFTGFPAGVTSGSYDHTFDTLDLATYNAPFVTANGGTAAGAEAALLSAMTAGRAYFNIHSSFAGGGEIRGFLQFNPVPEPTTFVLAGMGALGLFFARRKRVG